MTFSIMPPDIIFRILLWLPVASLLRLKRVSRDWLSLIQSSHFVYQHLRFENDDNHRIILLSCPDMHNNQQVSLFSVQNQTELLLDFPIIDDPYKCDPVEIVASCHGIICLRQNRRVCLWNPATKQSTNLPPLPQVPIVCHIGFGFDVKTNCYKVVCMNRNTKCTTHIYGFSSNSWRIIQGFMVEYSPFCFSCDLKTPYRDSIYCWLLSPDDNSPYIILSFDFSNEVFKTTPLPDSVIQPPSTLFILRENITCITKEGEYSYLWNRVSQRYEVWTLNDYNVKESWTKLYLIELFALDIHWMTWFSKNGDFLLFLERQQLCLYDTVAQETEELPVQVDYGFEFVMYKESLVSFERGSSEANGPSSAGRCALLSMDHTSWGDAGISEELVFKILLWLPAVSLLRFKLVCKSWCSLIKSSEFVAEHLHIHQNDNENINIILHSGATCRSALFEDSSYPSPATSYTCLLSTDKLDLLDLPYIKRWAFKDLTIAASFDGIICLRVSNEIIAYLWNPATKQFRVVMDELTGVLSRAYEERDYHLGFGFDVKTNDYKLVRFYKIESYSEVKVYSLSTDSWRSIHDEVLPIFNSIWSAWGTPYRKGINCWVAEIDICWEAEVDSQSHFCAILSFDFSNEVFGTVALPDSITYQWSFVLELAVLRENIACIALDKNYYSEEAVNWHCEIWVMTEYGVKDSWHKLYTVGPFSQDWRLGTEYSKKSGDYILLLKDGELYEYKLVTQETRKLPVQVPESEDYDVVVYKESLVPIRRVSS